MPKWAVGMALAIVTLAATWVSWATVQLVKIDTRMEAFQSVPAAVVSNENRLTRMEVEIDHLADTIKTIEANQQGGP